MEMEIHSRDFSNFPIDHISYSTVSTVQSKNRFLKFESQKVNPESDNILFKIW